MYFGIHLLNVYNHCFLVYSPGGTTITTSSFRNTFTTSNGDAPPRRRSLLGPPSLSPELLLTTHPLPVSELAYLGVSYVWTRTIHDLWGPASFTWRPVFKVQPRCGRCQSFISFGAE